MSEEITLDITITIPGPDAPGFLRRQKQAMEFGLLLKGELDNLNPEAVDSMVKFILPFVDKPQDREEAEEALWEMSENQFAAVMGEIQGTSAKKNEEIVPEVPSGN